MSRNQKFIKNLQRFRLITFDITETLLDFRMTPFQQYAKTATELGVKVDVTSVSNCFRPQFKAMKTKYPNFGSNSSTPGMDWRQWWTQLVENVFRCVDNKIPNEKLREIAEKLICQYGTSECWKLIGDGREVVQRVRAAGKNVGAISNFDPRLHMILKEMGIEKDFDFVLLSYECGAEKPQVEIFQIPLERYKLSAHEALHIGNMYGVDYEGARNAGWSSLLITKNSADAEKTEDGHSFTSLKDMMNTLETVDMKW